MCYDGMNRDVHIIKAKDLCSGGETTLLQAHLSLPKAEELLRKLEAAGDGAQAYEIETMQMVY